LTNSFHLPILGAVIVPAALHDPKPSASAIKAWPLLKGYLRVEKDKVSVWVRCDILEYYAWFIAKEFWLKVHLPKHGAHVSIVLPTIHDCPIPLSVKKENGRVIWMKYDPKIQIGGTSKGFRTFYLRIRSKKISEIRRICGASPPRVGEHLTIGNTKGLAVGYWPQTIEIR
jgi:hypothetical protein